MVFLVELFVLLANTFSASSLSTGGCYSSSLPLKLVEVPLVRRRRRLCVGGGVGPDVPGCGVGCGGGCSSRWGCRAGSMGILFMKLFSSSFSACAAALFSC
jgi:hypothetical protein